MHVISYKTLREFIDQYPDAETPLNTWFKKMEKSNFSSPEEMLPTFGSQNVDKVGVFYYFDIGGNKYRLKAAIHFNRHKVFVRRVMTHAEYDQETKTAKKR